MDTIGLRDTGAAVGDVQRRLRALGHAIDDEDGTFGESTAVAVRAFQRDRRLGADGVVGADTWSALVDAGFELGDRLVYLTRPVLRGDDVRELQRSLSRLGFDTGPTDGRHGALTDAALRDFQHNAGLRVDGIVGSATLRTLRSLRRHHQAATTFEVLDRHGTGPLGLVGRTLLVDAAGDLPDRTTPDGALTGPEVSLDIARRLVGQLGARGAHAVLTGATASSPGDRAQLANRLDVDALVSVTTAWVSQPAARGVSGMHFGDGVVVSERGRRLAMACVDTVAEATGTENCDVHPSTASLLRESRAPAVSVEVGFLSNERDGRVLATSEGRHAIATALAGGIAQWLGTPD